MGVNYDGSLVERSVVTAKKVRQFFLCNDKDVEILDSLLVNPSVIIEKPEYVFSQEANTFVVLMKWTELQKEKVSPFGKKEGANAVSTYC